MALFSKTANPSNRGSKSKATKASSKSKVVTGGVKTRDKKKLAFLSLAGVLVIATLGYGGNVLWQKHNYSKLAEKVNANAASVGALTGNYGGIKTYACRKPYSTNRPDEVWVLAARYSNADAYVVGVAVNIPGQQYKWSSSYQWWAGLQKHVIPVGRANINNGAYLSISSGAGGEAYYLADDTYAANYSQRIFYGGDRYGVGSLTSSYTGARNTVRAMNGTTYHLPLIKNLPVCNY